MSNDPKDTAFDSAQLISALANQTAQQTPPRTTSQNSNNIMTTSILECIVARPVDTQAQNEERRFIGNENFSRDNEEK